jgi:hypothetical protein
VIPLLHHHRSQPRPKRCGAHGNVLLGFNAEERAILEIAHKIVRARATCTTPPRVLGMRWLDARREDPEPLIARTPITYVADGPQSVFTGASGHARRGARFSDALFAFALPPPAPDADVVGLPLSITELDRCDRSRAGPDILYGERGQGAALAVDAVRRQAAGRGACSEEKSAAGIEAKSARHCFGRHVTGERQDARVRRNAEPDDAVVTAIADIKEPAGRGQMDLGACVAQVDPRRQGRDCLHRRQRAIAGIDTVRRDAAALLVREIGEIEAGVKTVVARPSKVRLRDLRG